MLGPGWASISTAGAPRAATAALPSVAPDAGTRRQGAIDSGPAVAAAGTKVSLGLAAAGIGACAGAGRSARRSSLRRRATTGSWAWAPDVRSKATVRRLGRRALEEGERPKRKPVRVVIAGAGPGGLALACALSRVQGLDVRILEARTLSQSTQGSFRSHSIGLGRRAREALISVGGEELWDRVKAQGFVATGFSLHLNGFALKLPPPEGEPVVLVDRGKICEALADHVASLEHAPGTTITLENGVRVEHVDLVGRKLHLDRCQPVQSPAGTPLRNLIIDADARRGPDAMSWDLLIGASGVRSAVRQAMSSQLPSRTFESEVKMKPGRWQVLNMSLPPSFAPGSVHAMVNSEAPFGLFCIPKKTGGFCVIVSWSNEETPAELLEASTPQELEGAILKYFPQIGSVPREAAQHFLEQSPSKAVISRCRPLHHGESHVCVLGDAAHAVGGGSLGQGCSAALQDAAALGACLLEGADALESILEGRALVEARDGSQEAALDESLTQALSTYSEQRAEEGWALLDLIELQAAGELRAGALLQGPVVMGFLIEQLGRGSLKPLADLGARALAKRLQNNQKWVSSELDLLPMLGLLHEQLALDTWKRFFDGMATLKPDMQTALMATDEPYSALVNRNTAWLGLLQISKSFFGAQQLEAVRGVTALRETLEPSQLLEWAAAFSPQERLKGDLIVRQSTNVRTFFAIASGSCAVLQNGEEVAVLGPGDHYGGIALLLGVPSSTSLVASTDAQLLEMPGEVFLRLVGGAGPKLREALSAPAERFHLGLDSVAAAQDEGRSRLRRLLASRLGAGAAELDDHLFEGSTACEIYTEGEVITLDERDCLRVLEQGRAAVVRRGAEVRRLGPGDFFGPDLEPGEQVVARGKETVLACRITGDAADVILPRLKIGTSVESL